MSLINKMLQDLDRRNAMGSASGPVPPQQVRAVSGGGSGHEWFWRILAVLSLIAVGWVGWVAYQLQPRSAVATELALNAGEQARRNPAPPAVKEATAPAPQPAAAREKPAASAPPASPPAAPPAVAPVARADPPPELFKLALSIDRPVPARAKQPAPATTPRAQAVKESPLIRVSRKDIPRPPADEAEALFRQGAQRLNEGRVSEAQENFSAALQKYAGHEASRQALIAIHIERRRLDEARKLLEEGLALNPAQNQFAAVLARVLVERGDYAGAANVLSTSQAAGASDADYQLLHGAVLQRLGRHAEAVELFERAAKLADQPGTTWVAMGISLEAVGRKAEALQAYRRSVSAGLTAQEIRSYAENRIRSLN
jgi:MSHA biogenesis protein MshN